MMARRQNIEPRFRAVLAAARPVLINGSVSGNGSILTLAGTGTPNLSYVLQTTTNLTSPATWTRILTNTTDGSGLFVFSNLLSPGNSHQFYRVLSP